MAKGIQKLALGAIRIYQKTLSPNHGVFAHLTPYGCKYFPSCSQYTYEAIEAQGVTRGVVLGVWRILRCNPFSRGGYDPAPKPRRASWYF